MNDILTEMQAWRRKLAILRDAVEAKKITVPDNKSLEPTQTEAPRSGDVSSDEDLFDDIIGL